MTHVAEPLPGFVAVEAKIELVIPQAVLVELAADLIVTAVEGGMTYWAAVDEYVWEEGRPELTRARIHCEEGDFDIAVPLMIEIMLDLLLGRAKTFLNWSYPATYRVRLLSALTQIETGVSPLETDYDFDAADASAMVQLATLGEVVY